MSGQMSERGAEAKWGTRPDQEEMEEDNIPPDSCRTYKGELKSSSGMVGEEVLYCPTHGIQWEDSDDAIRRVI